MISGNTISGNSGSWGGGFMFWYSGTNALIGNTISDNNSAFSGGGMYFSYSGGNTLTGNTISGNSGGGAAGGISFSDSDSNTLTGNRIEDNTAQNEGGAIYIGGCDNNDFGGNIIRFNHTTAGQTGGIFVASGSRWLSLNGGPEAYNTICYNDGYEVYNNNTFYGGDGRHDIDARNVLWCTDDTDEIQAGIYDFFDDASRAMVLWYPFIWAPPPGDLDGDGDVDLDDFVAFSDCLSGPDVAFAPGCDEADLDGDADVDLDDFALFQAAFTGPQ